MTIIDKYFPLLAEDKRDVLMRLPDLYSYWNERINVISRKDIENICEKHILHSLSIAKYIDFKDGTRIMDVGTGGGFPGIPLAIMFPNCEFTLVDSIGKKIKVVEEVALALGLKNVRAVKARVEDIDDRFDFIVSRAVTTIPEFMKWVKNKVDVVSINAIPNGIIYIKGGDVEEELKGIKKRVEIKELSEFFDEEFFETKKIIYIASYEQ